MDNVKEVLNILKEILVILDDLYLTINYERSKRWLNRKWIVNPINEERLNKGFFHTLYQELKNDNEKFLQYTRMDLETFKCLLEYVKPYLLKRKRKDVITAEERLILTIRYLASGDEIFSLALIHRIGESTAYNIIHETCIALHTVLVPLYLRPPAKPAWKNISKGFECDWNMPNCVGAIDGKHIQITAPPNSGSCFFNYKGYHSIVLLAACNHRYEFTMVEIGAFGGESDGGVLSRSEFGRKLEEGSLDLPRENKKLLNSSIELPYFFVGNEAFPLKNYLMRPFPGRNLDHKKRIFNYRLSRARRCIENAFGILSARWRVLKKSISFYTNCVDDVILACVCLHNYLMAQTQKSVRNSYCPLDLIDELNCSESVSSSQNLIENNLNVENNERRRSRSEAHAIRNSLADYFISPEGEVSWQSDYVMRGSYRDQ